MVSNSSKNTGQHFNAVEAYEKALSAYSAGEIKEASKLCRQILSMQPEDANTLNLLGSVAQELGKPHDAVDLVHRALEIAPNNQFFLNNLGLICHMQNNLEAAKEAFASALDKSPNFVEALNNQAALLLDMEKTQEAADLLEKALAIHPDFPAAVSNMGKSQAALGRVEEAIAYYDRALALAPNMTATAYGRLGLLPYSPDHSNKDIFDQAIAYWSFQPTKVSQVHFLNTKKSERSLRLGYVSSDLNEHPVGRFLEPVIKSHDRSVFQIYLYSCSEKQDGLTDRLRALSDSWRDCVQMSDEHLKDAIASDKIDILIDLSGHTAGNRLGVFRERAAPLQVTWLGFCTTTGLPNMDYIIADKYVLPPNEDTYFCEQVIRLPDSYLCLDPPNLSLKARPLQTGEAEFLTFGCLNNVKKLNQHVIETWSKLLDAIPTAKLLLKDYRLSEPAILNRIVTDFRRSGISLDRLILMKQTSDRADHLAAYSQVDIALDPFPFGGGTTTIEALWMGVPVITLRGTRWAGRLGESFLTNVGLPDFVANSEDEYISIAKKLANDPVRLQNLKSALRTILLASPLCDVGSFTRHLETVYRDIWTQWCHSQGTAA